MELAAGRIESINPNAILASIANGIARDATVSLPKVPQLASAGVSQALIGGAIMHEPIRADRILSSAAGTMIGTAVGSSIATAIIRNSPTVQAYYQQQAANEALREKQEQESHQRADTLPAYLHGEYAEAMQQQSKAYHQAVEAYLEGTPLKAATHRKPVTLFGHQPKAASQQQSRLGRVQAERQMQWNEKVKHMEHWSKGELYDTKTDTLYEPQAKGGYKAIHNFRLVADDPFSNVPILGMEAAIAKGANWVAGKIAGNSAIVGLKRLEEKLLPKMEQTSERFRLWGNTAKDAKVVGENTRLISNIKRVSSDIANAPFKTEKALAEGWKPPYPANTSLRQITLAKETGFYRVHTDPSNSVGRFLARESEIAPYLNHPEALRVHLGLPEVPIYITEVKVPAGTTLLTGRIGPQPALGLMEKSGFQYQTIKLLPKSSFVNTRLIQQPNINIRY